jgi:SsrA-binding protein
LNNSEQSTRVAGGFPPSVTAAQPTVLSMAKPKNKTKSADKGSKSDRPIAENRKARRQFEVLDTLECGIVLVGSEVKSLRKGAISLDEAYGRITHGEVWLVNSDIAEYVEANQFNHDAKRPRKLLMHRREIRKFANKAFEQGLTLVPLKMYFKEGRAKVLLGICKGRKLFDKREVLKARTMQRDMNRAIRRG